VIECRELITRKIANTLEYSYETKSVGEIPKWRKDKTQRILDHLRITETIVVLIGEDRGSSDEILESASG
jgi:phage gpG-like protein